jgi:hypothetical protein
VSCFATRTDRAAKDTGQPYQELPLLPPTNNGHAWTLADCIWPAVSERAGKKAPGLEIYVKGLPYVTDVKALFAPFGKGARRESAWISKAAYRVG